MKKQSVKRKVLSVVMDGVGLNPSSYGNAVELAYTPYLNFLANKGLATALYAHGQHVGLPSNKDIGNSEVGHNALGAGRIYEQGAKLVQSAIESGSMFSGETWKGLVANCINHDSVLHLLGLLSDGNVHSNEEHLYAMLKQAKLDGVKRVRVHALLDGRDVPERSAEVYIDRLLRVLNELNDSHFDACVASGGGRMKLTMDRYEADWEMVAAGWRIHVLGQGRGFTSITQALEVLRDEENVGDQNLSGFVIVDERGEPRGRICDDDAVICFNFRGDRAIEISRAFTEPDLRAFDRPPPPKVFYAGMMEYDGDLHIPKNFLVSPPTIRDTMGEYLVKQGVRQFACSETQKFGHVTFFWNGNRSGYFDRKLEDYLEIPSDNISFDEKPWMKAKEITDATIEKLRSDTFDFARINFANGDMVGHTGNFEAAVVAVGVVDLMVGRLMEACKLSDTILVVTADHGNCDEMFDAKSSGSNSWESDPTLWPKPKTSHTLAKVPLYIFDPRGKVDYRVQQETKSLAHFANTMLDLMGLETNEMFLPSLIERV